MEFLQIGGFDVQPGREFEFQAWVKDNLNGFQKAMPDGVDLVGIYADIFNGAKNTGTYRIIFRLDSYGAMDRLAACKQTHPDLAKYMEAFADFNDLRLGAGSSNVLFKAVADCTIWADRVDK